MNRQVLALGLGAFVAGVVSLVGCGSSVTNGTGGGGGGTGTTTGTTGAGMQACLDMCAKLTADGCAGSFGTNCATACQEFYDKQPAECAAVVSDIFICWANDTTVCPDDPPAACEEKVDALEECSDTYGCSPGTCEGWGGPDGESGCTCSQTCLGQEQEVSCTTTAAGTTTCDCSINGVHVASCTDTSDGCDFDDGCCGPYFQSPDD